MNNAAEAAVDTQTVRSARRAATLAALPLALLAGFVVFQQLLPAPAPPAALPSPSPKAQPSAPVTMPAPPLEERHAIVCRALLSQLPETIRDLPRRQVTAGHEQNAAFGDPPLTVACGGVLPSLAPTDFVYPMNGVCWHADASGTRWTTVDREVPVTVTVPREYEQPGQWVIALSHPILSTIPSGDIPSGCAQ